MFRLLSVIAKLAVLRLVICGRLFGPSAASPRMVRLARFAVLVPFVPWANPGAEFGSIWMVSLAWAAPRADPFSNDG
jgi:hypothetical protein